MIQAADSHSHSTSDLFVLSRFEQAQAECYAAVVEEIRAGRKRTHWMWFIFPQFAGLAPSATSRHFAIQSREEAVAYLAHPVLGPRLLECAQAALEVEDGTARAIFGSPADLKLHSCATLFASVSPAGSVFERLLDGFFGGSRDSQTLRLMDLNAKSGA